jgi:DNA-binding beta-propeller fold protein YncE
MTDRTVSRIVVTSASGSNGAGFGALLGFDLGGRRLGCFSSDPRISDPRGVRINPLGSLLYLNSGDDRLLALNDDGMVVYDSGRIAGLNPGGGQFFADGGYYVGLRSAATVMAFSAQLDRTGSEIFPRGIVPYPRGFAIDDDGQFYLASGIGPSGEGDNAILVFADTRALPARLIIRDPGLSPLDLAVAPSGNLVVSSEHPFGVTNATTSIREYARGDGRLLRVLTPNESCELRSPRGLRFGPDGLLYCVARDEVIAFDFINGRCLGAVIRLPCLYGQAIEFF